MGKKSEMQTYTQLSSTIQMLLINFAQSSPCEKIYIYLIDITYAFYYQRK